MIWERWEEAARVMVTAGLGPWAGGGVRAEVRDRPWGGQEAEGPTLEGQEAVGWGRGPQILDVREERLGRRTPESYKGVALGAWTLGVEKKGGGGSLNSVPQRH